MIVAAFSGIWLANKFGADHESGKECMRDYSTLSIDLGRVLILIAVVVIALPMGAVSSDGGRTAADFLRVGLGARAAGMGDANTASSQGAEAAYWNPAGLTAMDGDGEVVLGHFSWFQDINVEHGACAVQLADWMTLAGSVTYVNYGDIDGYALDGSATGEKLVAYDLGGIISAGVSICEHLSAGVSVKIINQHLDHISARALAMDFGLRGNIGDLTLAGVLVNIGRDIRFDGVGEELPTALRLGVSALHWGRFVNTSVDIELPRRGPTTLKGGLELNFQDLYYLRGGLKIRPAEAGQAMNPGPTFGAGMRLGATDLNYAYTIGSSFASDALHRFSVTIHIGR